MDYVSKRSLRLSEPYLGIIDGEYTIGDRVRVQLRATKDKVVGQGYVWCPLRDCPLTSCKFVCLLFWIS
jgi:hypothetical protein